MGIRKRKPTSPGMRFQTVSDFADITKSTPEKTLLAKKTSAGGRNAYFESACLSGWRGRTRLLRRLRVGPALGAGA
jgi:ribosomal protein L2